MNVSEQNASSKHMKSVSYRKTIEHVYFNFPRRSLGLVTLFIVAVIPVSVHAANLAVCEDVYNECAGLAEGSRTQCVTARPQGRPLNYYCNNLWYLSRQECIDEYFLCIEV